MPRKTSTPSRSKPSTRPLRVATVGPTPVLPLPQDTRPSARCRAASGGRTRGPAAPMTGSGAAGYDPARVRAGRPMENVLAGVRVLEVAQWWFVPSAGAVLAD